MMKVEKCLFINRAPFKDNLEICFQKGINVLCGINGRGKTTIISYIVDATRHTETVLPQELSRYVRMGASPRASIAFMKIAKAVALIYGRTYVIPDDVKLLRHQVLRHRVELNYAAIADNVSVETIIDRLVGAIQTP